jgi:hypothetical protein
MNPKIIRLTYVALGLVAVLVVMTTYWQTWAAPELAARQDNSIRRVAEFSIDRLIFSFEPRKRLARNRSARSTARRSSSAGIPTVRWQRTSSDTRRSGARERVSSGR